jgi:4-amino-4-deoxy-L-arabinose transferase-like glycosyltransferase
MDEFTHLTAGYRYLQCGEFANNPEHPPLFKLIAAMPIRNWQISGFLSSCGSRVVQSRSSDMAPAGELATSEHHNDVLWKARSALIVFPFLLLVAVFFATRRWFGDLAATVAVLLVTIEPTLVAHGSLITSDMPVTAFVFLTVWAAISLVQSPSWWKLLALSLALGLGLASKHSAAALPAISLLTMFVVAWLRRAKTAVTYLKILGAWSCACFFAILILWGSYGFRYAALPNETQPAYDFATWFHSAGMERSLEAKTVMFGAKHHLLPEAYLAGLTDIFTFNSRPAYFFGRVHPSGFWYYFPVALAIKLTLGLLALFAIGLVSKPVQREHGRVIAPLIVPIVLFLAVAMIGKLDIGVRHVLPIIPFMIVIAAAAFSVMLRSSRTVAALAGFLLAISLISSLHASPAQLSYANEVFGGADRLHLYLGDSNVDWGQSSEERAAYEVSHHLNQASQCAVVSGVPWDRSRACLVLPTLLTDLVSGEVPPIISGHFEGTLLIQPMAVSWSSAYASLVNRKPDEVAAHGTILVFKGKFEMPEIAALRRLNRGMLMFFMRNPAGAIEEFAAAERDCPETDRVRLHSLYAGALFQQKRVSEAQVHAQEVLRLTEHDPSYRFERQAMLDGLGKH